MKLLDKMSLDDLKNKADQIRADVVDVCVRNGAGHIAPSLSCIDLLTTLYYRVMNLSESPQWPGRDRLIFSKAHGCYGLYAILSDIGFLDRKDWMDFYRGSFLSGCLERSLEHGIEAGCGSLGHGLPIAVGIAFGAKLQDHKYRVYCIVGDGELQEGSNWEAIQFAAKHRLTNLTLLIDCNKLQAMDFLENILSIQDVEIDLNKKLAAFGFEVKTCDGHNVREIESTLNWFIETARKSLKPQAVIARTVKGYSLVCMENIPKFHFRVPSVKELEMGNRYGCD